MRIKYHEPVIVLGSKPDAKLPNISAQYVYGVNGAVEIAVKYRERFGSEAIGFVRTVELRKFEHIQESFKKASPDCMIVAGDDDDIVSFIRNDLGLSNVDIVRISTKERLSIMETVLGWRKWMVMAERIKIRGLKHFLSVALPDIILCRNKDWLSHSTGFDTIMYIMKHHPSRPIISAGICPVGGGHFNKIGQFTDKTALSDQGTLAHWPICKRKKLLTTDKDFNKGWGVPLWKGETFKF